MAGIRDYINEIKDIVVGLFNRRTEEEKKYPYIAVRKQREILRAVGDEKRAKLVKDTMCTIGFDSISDNATWKAAVGFYEALDWDEEKANEYLNHFFVLRDSISNSKKQQFSRLNRNRKVDNVAILQQTVDLLDSDLSFEEVKDIIKACTVTGTEISEARRIWENEKDRAKEDGFEGEDIIKEAKYFYDKIINLARLTTDTTLTDARDVIRRGTYVYKSKSDNFVERAREMLTSIESKVNKKKSENQQDIEIISTPEIKNEDIVHGLDYNRAHVEALESAINRAKSPNKQVYNKPLKLVARDFVEFYNLNDENLVTDEYYKRVRKKAAAFILGIGIGVAGILGIAHSKDDNKKNEPQVTGSTIESNDESQSPENILEDSNNEVGGIPEELLQGIEEENTEALEEFEPTTTKGISASDLFRSCMTADVSQSRIIKVVPGENITLKTQYGEEQNI